MLDITVGTAFLVTRAVDRRPIGAIKLKEVGDVAYSPGSSLLPAGKREQAREDQTGYKCTTQM